MVNHSHCAAAGSRERETIRPSEAGKSVGIGLITGDRDAMISLRGPRRMCGPMEACMNETVSLDVKAKLRKIMLFQYLSDEEIEAVVKLAEVQTYDEGERIISEGDVSQYMYAVLDGTVSVLVRERSGKDIYVSAIGEGDIFGEAGIFLKVKRTANVVSTDQATVLALHRNSFLSFIKAHHAAGMKMLMIIVYSLLRKLRESNQELAFERKSTIAQDDIDSMVEDLMNEI